MGTFKILNKTLFKGGKCALQTMAQGKKLRF